MTREELNALAATDMNIIDPPVREFCLENTLRIKNSCGYGIVWRLLNETKTGIYEAGQIMG